MFRCLISPVLFISCAFGASPSLVIIDAGHGGPDSGGTGNGLVEKKLTLDTALRLQKILAGAGIKTWLLRESDRFIDLDVRVAMANRYIGREAVLVSIHFNAVSGAGAHGAETFFWRPDATALATRIQKNLSRRAGLLNLGINRRRLRLTRNPEIPAVLVEGAYMTNRNDAALIANERGRELIARGIADGIIEYKINGDSGIRRVPEVSSPLSRKSDAGEAGQRVYR